MKKLNDDDIIIYDEDGKEYLYKILFTYENQERGAEYCFIYEPSSEDEIIVMKYNEEHELFPVEDEEELEEAEEVLEAYQADPKIQEIK